MPDDKRLVAYLVVDDKQVFNPTALRRQLKEELPEYMVPSAFTLLDEMPLTPSGKIDRKALAAPDPSKLELDGGLVPARTPIEQMLAGIIETAHGQRCERVFS